MQRLTIFSIYDSKAKAYLQPFFSNNVETATREFTSAVNGEGQFNKYAEDYSMFLLGTFDQDEGSFILESAPIHCCNAITLIHNTNIPVVPYTDDNREPAPGSPESNLYEVKETT